MPSKAKSLNFTPKNTSCYICGKSLAEFKSYFNFSSHQDEHNSQTGKAGNEAEKQIAHYYSQFVDHYRSKFFEFYDQLMKLPAPIDNLTYTNLKSKQEQQTLHKMFPGLRNFDYNILLKWGFTHMPNKKRTRGKGNNIGEFKELCTEIYHDFKNKVLNRDIIQIINQWYNSYEGYPVPKPEFLGPLNENLGKLKETKKPLLPEIVFSEKMYSFTTVNQVTVTYIYHLCPLCRHISKS